MYVIRGKGTWRVTVNNGVEEVEQQFHSVEDAKRTLRKLKHLLPDDARVAKLHGELVEWVDENLNAKRYM